MSKARWPALAKHNFRQTDLDGVSARRQIRHGQREIRPVNFLAERFLGPARRAGNGQAVPVLTVAELAADQHLPVAGGADLFIAEGGGGEKAGGESRQRKKNHPLHDG